MFARNPRRRRCSIVLTAAAAVAASIPAAAGIIVEDRPVSLLSANVIMERGVPCIPLADVARALGGTLQVNLERRLLRITPGRAGALKLNPRSPMLSRSDAAAGLAAGQTGVILQLNGSQVMFEEFEFILLRPNPLMPLSLLGRLLGGNARLDPKSNSWVLPNGGPGSPLAFR
ncbi:MAG: hypothetical protein ACOY3Y_15775 [Acidobacteriota bacterium]